MRRLLIAIALAVLPLAVQADSTRFINAAFQWTMINSSDNEATWTNFSNVRAERTTSTHASKILCFLDGVRDSIGTDEVTLIVCSTKTYAIDVACSLGVHAPFKGYSEDNMSWVNWNQSSGFAWGTTGAENASDAGDDNTGDGTGYDRSASAWDTTADISAGGWYVFNIRVGDSTNAGDYQALLQVLETDGNVRFHTEEAAAEADRPRAWVYHTAAAASSAGRIIMID